MNIKSVVSKTVKYCKHMLSSYKNKQVFPDSNSKVTDQEVGSSEIIRQAVESQMKEANA